LSSDANSWKNPCSATESQNCHSTNVNSNPAHSTNANPDTVSHPNTNRVQRRSALLIKTNAPPLYQTTTKTSESLLLLGDRRPVSVSGTSDRLMASIKPLLSSQIVTEFNCIYKFVVMDELQVVHVYFLDLKHGQHTLSVSFHLLLIFKLITPFNFCSGMYTVPQKKICHPLVTITLCDLNRF